MRRGRESFSDVIVYRNTLYISLKGFVSGVERERTNRGRGDGRREGNSEERGFNDVIVYRNTFYISWKIHFGLFVT